jgi:hypothetical protein
MLGTCLNYFSDRRMREAGLGNYNYPANFEIGASGPLVYVKLDHIPALEPRRVHGAVVEQPGFRMKAARPVFRARAKSAPVRSVNGIACGRSPIAPSIRHLSLRSLR